MSDPDTEPVGTEDELAGAAAPRVGDAPPTQPATPAGSEAGFEAGFDGGVAVDVAGRPATTRPFTTVAPEPFLDEVIAVYEQAQADLYLVYLSGDAASPLLARHIADAQLDRLRTVIRGYSLDGISAQVDSGPRWWRIEAAEVTSNNEVRLNVCRHDGLNSVDATGAVVGPSTRHFRFLETMQRIEGGWKWVARDWIDPPGDTSDCASP